MRLNKQSFIIFIKLLSIVTMTTLMVASCNYTKNLAADETLYLGSKLKIVDTTLKKNDKEDLEAVLISALRPLPNKKIFGVKFKLGVYNFVGVPAKEKGLKHYLRTKIGEPPILGATFNPKQNELILKNILQNNGYFYPEIKSNKIVDTVKKTTKGEFEVLVGTLYKIRNVTFPVDDTSELAKDIIWIADSTKLKKGIPYTLQIIEDERDRIDNYLKNNGYYYFNPNYLLARVDTGTGTDSVDIKMDLKYDIIAPNVFYKYKIRNVYVNSNYQVSLNKRRVRASKATDTVAYENYKIVDRKQTFKPYVFKQAIQLKEGDAYSRYKQNISLNRLVSLNAFKFIKNEFTPIKNIDSAIDDIHELDLTYLLTPYTSKAVNIETAGFSQNDSRVGSRLSINWKNRNVFKGGEQFNVKLTGGFEMQYGGNQGQLPNLYQAGIETSLNIPRILFGSALKLKPSSVYIPRTNLSLGYNFYLKATLYKLNTFNFNYNYTWKEDAKRDHKLSPLNITYVVTDTLDRVSPFNISNILFNGVMIGPTYEFTYNTKLGKNDDQNFYFNGLTELSCNILGLAQGSDIKETGEYNKILGSNYAQFVKVQGDFRYYKKFRNDKMWANRLFLGAGYAYGNSVNMPNIKQFFVGGAGSLRGYRSRYLGPGTFYNGSFTGTSSTQFIELLGDIKLEANTEWRTKLYSTWLKGAAFVDAGNIWLVNKNPDFPGGEFTKNFYKEIAVSAGVGLRFDFSILVLRLDFGIPLRKPWYPEGNRWVFNEIDPGSKSWRKENIIFNLAIGYPF